MLWFGGVSSISRDLHACIRSGETNHTHLSCARMRGSFSRTSHLVAHCSPPPFHSRLILPSSAACLQGPLCFQSHLLLLAFECPGASFLRFDLGNRQLRAGWFLPSAAKAISKCGAKAQLLIFSLLDTSMAAKTNYWSSAVRNEMYLVTGKVHEHVINCRMCVVASFTNECIA